MFLLLYFSLILSDTSVTQYSWPMSIYEVGKVIQTSEDNFENLFHNWNAQNVKNADELKLLNYEFNQVIFKESQMRAFLDSVQAIDYPFSLLLKQTASDKKNSNCSVWLRSVQGKNLSKDNIASLVELNAFKKEVFFTKIRYGTKVYNLFVEHRERGIKKKYRLFVFIDGETNRVIADFFFTIVPIEFLYDKPQLKIR